MSVCSNMTNLPKNPITITPASGGSKAANWDCFEQGGVVFLQGHIDFTSDLANGSTIGSIPVEFAPSVQKYGICGCSNTSNADAAQIVVSTAGVLSFGSVHAMASRSFVFSIIYQLD